MNLYPFQECVTAAEKYIRFGGEVYQQWNCSHCGTKQTMDEANVFFKTGQCEKCAGITDIEKNGCNYMLHVQGHRA